MRWLTGLPQIPILHDAPNFLVALRTTPLMLKAFIRPFGRTFEVTQKGGDHARRKVNWGILLTVLVLLAALLGSLGLTADADVRLLYGGQGQRSMLVNLFWGAHAALILCVAAMLSIERPRPRRDERFLLDEDAKIFTGSNPFTECRIEDLSVGGARVLLEGRPPPEDGETVKLHVEGVGEIRCDALQVLPLKLAAGEMPSEKSKRKRRNATASGEQRAFRMRLKFSKLDDPQREALIRKLFGGDCATESMVPLSDAAPIRTVLSALYRVVS